MKFLLISLACLGVVCAQTNFFKVRTHNFGSAVKKVSVPESNSRAQVSRNRSGPAKKPRNRSRNRDDRNNVDVQNGGSDYHFSWKHRNSKFVWDGANSYCKGLGSNWAPVSIGSRAENQFITQAISRDRVDYIWTGGRLSGRRWSWPSNEKFENIGWSKTGGLRKPQPDNREGSENCLAILNNIYRNDGITWHDIGCSHRKPVVCERKSR